MAAKICDRKPCDVLERLLPFLYEDSDGQLFIDLIHPRTGDICRIESGYCPSCGTRLATHGSLPWLLESVIR